MKNIKYEEKNNFFIPKDSLWMLALVAYFIVGFNTVWRNNTVLWYGTIAFLGLAYIVTYDKVSLEKFDFIAWYLSFYVLCVFSLAWCLSPSLVMATIKTLTSIFILMLLLHFAVNNGFSLDKIIVCFFVATLFNMIYLITNIDLAELGETQIGVDLIEGWNGNAIGFTAAEGALAGFYLIDKSKSKLLKFSILAVNIFFFFVSMYTGSRTAFAMLVSGILLYVYIKKPTKVLRNIILTLVLLYIVGYLIMNVEGLYNVLGKRIESLLALFTGEGKADTSATHRDTFIQNGKMWFKEAPLIGYGIDNYKILDKGATGMGFYSHNNYIEIAVDLGSIGLIVYYSAYLVVLMRLYKISKKNMLNAFLLAALIASLISQYGTVSYYSIYHNLLLFMCFAAINNSKENANTDSLCTTDNTVVE